MQNRKHKQMFCKECGSSIGFTYVVPIREYCITEDGEIERDDNNLSDDPFIEFYCNDDKSHNIGDEKELFIWMDVVRDDFFERALYSETR